MKRLLLIVFILIVAVVPMESAPKNPAFYIRTDKPIGPDRVSSPEAAAATEAPYSRSSSMQMNNHLDGTGETANCMASLTSTTEGKDGKPAEQGSGDIFCSINAEVLDGNIRLRIGQCTLMTKTNFSNEAGSGGSDTEADLGGIEAAGLMSESNTGGISGPTIPPEMV